MTAYSQLNTAGSCRYTPGFMLSAAPYFLLSGKTLSDRTKTR